MKKVYNTLKVFLWCWIGAFIGSSLYRYVDFRSHPGLYAMQSAPWYTSIGVGAVFTALVVAVLLVAMWAIRKKRR